MSNLERVEKSNTFTAKLDFEEFFSFEILAIVPYEGMRKTKNR